jgi:hypothetical protein
MAATAAFGTAYIFWIPGCCASLAVRFIRGTRSTCILLQCVDCALRMCEYIDMEKRGDIQIGVSPADDDSTKVASVIVGARALARAENAELPPTLKSFAEPLPPLFANIEEFKC